MAGLDQLEMLAVRNGVLARLGCGERRGHDPRDQNSADDQSDQVPLLARPTCSAQLQCAAERDGDQQGDAALRPRRR